MNPRQMREYKHSQAQKRKQEQFEREQRRMKAEHAKMESIWRGYVKLIVTMLKATGKEQEYQRAKQEFGRANMEGGNMVTFYSERMMDDGNLICVVGHKFFPRPEVCDRPQFSTTTETKIHRASWEKKYWADKDNCEEELRRVTKQIEEEMA